MDQSPLLCAPEDKPSLEARNGDNQLLYITDLVNRLGAREVRTSQIKELHSIAIEGIYPCGGTYRDARFEVVIHGSDHKLPSPAFVPSLVDQLVDELNVRKSDVPAIDRVALALWRLNWIHPFRGGNGRTARATAYLILCMDLDMVPPGRPQFPTVIYERRDAYVSALQHADATLERTGTPDLQMMIEVVDDAITRQMASAIAALGKPKP